MLEKIHIFFNETRSSSLGYSSTEIINLSSTVDIGERRLTINMDEVNEKTKSKSLENFKRRKTVIYEYKVGEKVYTRNKDMTKLSYR